MTRDPTGDFDDGEPLSIHPCGKGKPQVGTRGRGRRRRKNGEPGRFALASVAQRVKSGLAHRFPLRHKSIGNVRLVGIAHLGLRWRRIGGFAPVTACRPRSSPGYRKGRQERVSDRQATSPEGALGQLDRPRRYHFSVTCLRAPCGLWTEADFGQRRELVCLVVERVRVIPARRGARFDPARVRLNIPLLDVVASETAARWGQARISTFPVARICPRPSTGDTPRPDAPGLWGRVRKDSALRGSHPVISLSN